MCENSCREADVLEVCALQEIIIPYLCTSSSLF